MRLKNSLYLITISGTLLITSCASINEFEKPSLVSQGEVAKEWQVKQPESLPALPLRNRIAWVDTQKSMPIQGSENLYSFVAENLPIRKALQVFGKAYQLNFIADSEVDGYLTLEFNDLPFEQAMSAMLDSLGLYWEREGELIKIKGWETRTFSIDYLRLVRSGQGSSLAQVNTTISESLSGDGSGGNDDGKFELSQEDSVEFWKELESQLSNLTSSEGRLSINRMSGTVQISDHHERVKEIEKYITDINHAIHRQVELDVKIVEVELDDDFSLGIDWSLVTAATASGLEGSIVGSTIIDRVTGGFSAQNPSGQLNIFEDDNGSLNFGTLLEALKQQGEVQVVSQPKIRTLNNQSAMIKVGTDQTFFLRTVTSDTTNGAISREIEDKASVVTEGLVLTLTPQIAANGWIMLDISPIITRINSISRAFDTDGNVTSTAPNLDIRQTSSLVRLKNGNTVAIGGLMQNIESNTNRSVPGLSEIPVAGKLFEGKYKLKRKREMVMFLTARLVDSNTAQIIQ